MPIYTYECSKCGTFDLIMGIEESKPERTCQCGRMAKKVIASPNIKCDSMNDVPWLKSAVENLQIKGEKPIETRQQYEKYLKDHNIVERG